MPVQLSGPLPIRPHPHTRPAALTPDLPPPQRLPSLRRQSGRPAQCIDVPRWLRSRERTGSAAIFSGAPLRGTKGAGSAATEMTDLPFFTSEGV